MGHRNINAHGKNAGDGQLPAHVLHDIRLAPGRPPFRYLRLFVLRGYTDWGISLWQFDVYGDRGPGDQYSSTGTT